MNKKIYILILICFVSIGLYLLVTNTRKEGFVSSKKYTSESLKDMFDSLEEAEKRCAVIEEKEMLNNQREELRNNQAVLNQLEELDKKILELKEIVRVLTIEKKRREGITNKCRASKQQKLNESYDLLENVKENIPKGLSIDVSLDGNNFTDETGTQVTPDFGRQCEIKDPKHYVKLTKDDNHGFKVSDDNGAECLGCHLEEQNILDLNRAPVIHF